MKVIPPLFRLAQNYITLANVYASNRLLNTFPGARACAFHGLFHLFLQQRFQVLLEVTQECDKLLHVYPVAAAAAAGSFSGAGDIQGIQLCLELPHRAVQIADMKRVPVKFLQRWPCFPLYCNHRADCGEDEENNTSLASPFFKSPINSLCNIYSCHRDKSLGEMWFGFSLVELKLGTQIMVDIEAPS